MLCGFWQGPTSLWTAFLKKGSARFVACLEGLGALGKVYQLLGKIPAA